MDDSAKQSTVFGTIPHQVRGTLSTFSMHSMSGQAFSECTACSPALIQFVQAHLTNVDAILPLLSDRAFLEQQSGLAKVHEAAASSLAADGSVDWDNDEDDF